MSVLPSDRSSVDTEKRRAFIASVAVATPHFSIDQAQSGEYLLRHYADKLSPRSLALTRKLFSHPSIHKEAFRHSRPGVFIYGRSGQSH